MILCCFNQVNALFPRSHLFISVTQHLTLPTHYMKYKETKMGYYVVITNCIHYDHSNYVVLYVIEEKNYRVAECLT